MHISLILAQDHGQSVLLFGARTLPELQNRGILSNAFSAASKLVFQRYLPDVKRARSTVDVTGPSSGVVFQRMGFSPVCSYHVGLYNYDNNTPTEKMTEALRVGNAARSLITPSDGNLDSVRPYDQSSGQLEVVDSALIPSGVLFEDTFVCSATTANLSTLMNQCHFYGSFDKDNNITALSYGDVSWVYDTRTWWCTISALDSDRVEDVVKVNCRSALEYVQRDKSGSPVNLVCYFTDVKTRNVADEVLSQLGFHVCDALPGHKKLSHIFIFQFAM